jgi:hypothetical protein
MRLILPFLFLAFGCQLVGADNAPARKPAPKDVPLDPQVQGILKGSVDFYTGLQSFEVDIDSIMRTQAPQMKNELDSVFELAMQRPNSVAFVMKAGMMGGTLITNGKTSITYEQALNKYTRGDAPATIEAIFSPLNLALVEGGLPIGIEAFFQKDALKAWQSGLYKSEYVGRETIANQPAEHVRLTTQIYVIDYWIATGAQPLLLQTEVTLDMSTVMKAIPKAQQQKMPASMSAMTMTRTTTYTKWQVNQPIAAATFQFQPPPEAKLVTEFFARPPHPLVGKMAP